VVNEFQWPAYNDENVSQTENKAIFHVPAVLRGKENQVMITSVYAKDSASMVPVVIPCSEPTTHRRLHLLVVGVGVDDKNKEQLENRACESLRLKRNDKNNKIVTLVGSDLGAKDIHTRLNRIKRALGVIARSRNDRRNQDKVCDVVMLYYEGGNIVQTARGAGISTRPLNKPKAKHLAEHTLTFNYLKFFVKSLPGAQILLLDLAQTPQSSKIPYVLDWRTKTQTAIFRYVWTNRAPLPNDPNSLLSTIHQVQPTFGLGDLDDKLIARSLSNSDVLYQSSIPQGMQSLRVGPE
jgi:hypothetical protein